MPPLDAHSQGEIASTLARLEKEVCVKFFNTPLNYNATSEDKILYIHNKAQRKECPPDKYDYSGSVVEMTIGYKCVNERDIARIVVEMLRASVQLKVSPVNSFDLVKKFQDMDDEAARPTLLSPADRHYINGHYVHECSNLNSHPGLHPSYRRTSGKAEEDADVLQMTQENKLFYNHKLWPWGIVMYGVQPELRDTPDHQLLKYAMTIMELESCMIFQEAEDKEGVLAAKNLLWFANTGTDAPALGFVEGNQTVNLHSAMHGAGGHLAHPIMNLMRAAGVPMASNRPDRDNYLVVNWQNILKGKEHYLEKYSEDGWIKQLPYDFDSITHAPANFLCNDACAVGETTVKPMQDHLWQRRMSMGHGSSLSETDRLYLKTIYDNECQQRFLPSKPGSDSQLIGSEYMEGTQTQGNDNPLEDLIIDNQPDTHGAPQQEYPENSGQDNPVIGQD